MRKVAISDTNTIKAKIQATLREIVIIRDKGCILRKSPIAGKCGGFRKDGELILQAEHLNSRIHSISFADPRLVVCLCQRHHIFWKPQEPALYNDLVRKIIGEQRCNLWDRVKEDRGAYKMDWKMELLALKQELKKLSTQSPK